NIEGIPADEGRAEYGGDKDDDNSGVLSYISIRHGGAALQADNEINGLTLGGVGSGTQIHHIEVFANEDDGIEFFGGTVDLKYGATIFCGDDGFDYDESWGGRGQFWFYISETDNGNCAGEHDGSERTDKQPKSFPVIYNATYIGSGSASGNAASIGLDMKDDAAAVYANSVFTGFSTGVRFRNRGTSDAYSRYMTDGDTKFLNNLWWDFAAGNDPNNFVVITDNQNGGVVGDVVAKLVAEGNQVIDPTLRGISRVPNQQLDPLPAAGSPLHQDLATATDSWFDVVDFKGAFGFDNWMFGWTALDKYGYLGDLSNTSTDFERNASGVSLMVPYPNPVTQGVATLAFELPASSDITVSVFDLTGRMVANTRYGKFVQGAHNLQLVTENFHAGLYVVALQTDFGTVTQKISVLKNN
ncbi:MAG: T9SS type A sorting domain-containing protein, partial [Saprospiraceae bacterium]|nr:T9SS type A sorting domain-containing protein [Saprospiraceae bacterium]